MVGQGECAQGGAHRGEQGARKAKGAQRRCEHVHLVHRDAQLRHHANRPHGGTTGDATTAQGGDRGKGRGRDARNSGDAYG